MTYNDDLLSVRTSDLFQALAGMLEIKPCKAKVPCFRRERLQRELAENIFLPIWDVFSAEEQENLRDRMLKCLYWLSEFKKRQVYVNWSDFQPVMEGRMWGMLEGHFEEWQAQFTDPRRIVFRMLCRSSRRTTSEDADNQLSRGALDYCAQALSIESRQFLKDKLLALLKCGCKRVGVVTLMGSLPAKKVLAVSYVDGEIIDVFD